VNDDTNTATPTIDRTDFGIPYQVVTQAPPLPTEVAALYTTDGKYPDDNKLAALDLEALAGLYHQARRYTKPAHEAYEEEITWLREALREAESAQRRTATAENALLNEWQSRRTTESITWQGVRKVLNAAGFVPKSEYSWQQKPGTTYDTRRADDTAVYATFENMTDLAKGRGALEAAGYAIKRVYDPGADGRDIYGRKPQLTVVKLREGQTIEDVNQPYTPPQTTEPA
jgi:hypothetical protein